jgi:ATP-dependent protease ClpP protease subunit
MPTPRKNEGQDAFITRCMGDREAMRSFPEAAQRRAFCQSQWDRSKQTSAIWTGLGGSTAAAWEVMESSPIVFHRMLQAWAQETKDSAQYRFRARAGGETGEILLYGPIGEDFFGEGITGASFAKELKKLEKAKTIDLHIDSPGGSVSDARVIYNQLTQHPAKINVHIDGLAASAASVVAMAGDVIKMAQNGFIMIHEARGVARGTAADFEKAAAIIRAHNGAIVDVYAARTANSRRKLEEWMSTETWFSSEDAVKNDFADEIVENKHKITASAYAAAFAAFPDKLPQSMKTRRIMRRIERLKS